MWRSRGGDGGRRARRDGRRRAHRCARAVAPARCNCRSCADAARLAPSCGTRWVSLAPAMHAGSTGPLSPDRRSMCFADSNVGTRSSRHPPSCGRCDPSVPTTGVDVERAHTSRPLGSGTRRTRTRPRSARTVGNHHRRRAGTRWSGAHSGEWRQRRPGPAPQCGTHWPLRRRTPATRQRSRFTPTPLL